MTTPTLKTGERLYKLYDGKNINEIKDALSSLALNTQQVYSYSLAVYYESIKQKETLAAELIAFSHGLKVEIEKRRAEGLKTPKQEENWLDWNQILVLRDLWKMVESDSYRFHQCYLALCCYTYLPPQRNNWANVHFADKTGSSAGNYLILTSTENPVVVFQDYKTAKTHGKITLSLPPPFVEILKDSFKRFPRDYLFQTKDNTAYTTSSLTHLLNDAFAPSGRQAGANILRHSYASFLHKDKPTLKEEEETAKQMGHSYTQNRLYALK